MWLGKPMSSLDVEPIKVLSLVNVNELYTLSDFVQYFWFASAPKRRLIQINWTLAIVQKGYLLYRKKLHM